MTSGEPPAHHAPSPLVHAVASFEFQVDAPLAKAAPLFGPEGERSWAGPDWNPVFLHPLPARDLEGAVFTVAHGGLTSVWVNTRFDLAAGRMQYVAFTPGLMTATIDVALHASGDKTLVNVTYRRTALVAEANDHVSALSQADIRKSLEWHDAIAAMLKAQTPPR